MQQLYSHVETGYHEQTRNRDTGLGMVGIMAPDLGEGYWFGVQTKSGYQVNARNNSGDKDGNVPQGCSGRFGRVKGTKKSAGTRMEADNYEESVTKGSG